MLSAEEREKYVNMAKKGVTKYRGEFVNIKFYAERFVVEYWDHAHRRQDINREIKIKNKLYSAEIFRKNGYRIRTPPKIPVGVGNGAS